MRVATGRPTTESGDRHRPNGGPEWALTYPYLFRRIVVGLALVGAGVAWTSYLPWLAAGLAIVTGE